MGNTRSGEQVSAQIANMGMIDVSSGNFSLQNGQSFQVKNDGGESVALTVRLACMDEGTFVTTRFECGWNPEIVKEIKHDGSLNNPDLKWGY